MQHLDFSLCNKSDFEYFTWLIVSIIALKFVSLVFGDDFVSSSRFFTFCFKTGCFFCGDQYFLFVGFRIFLTFLKGNNGFVAK